MSDNNDFDNTDTDNTDITRFASLVAHQLKSPVAAAGAIIKTLLGEYAGSLTPQQKDLLFRANNRIEEAVHTSNRMVSIANPDKLNEGSDLITDFTLIIRKVHADFLEEAAVRGISFSVKIDLEPAYVTADESSLTEVLNSLVSNALKYTPANGSIEVYLAGNRFSDGTETVELSVSDSGIGVPSENYDKIFKPFFRSAASQGSTLPGSGLGLSLVYSITSSLNGKIIAGKSRFGGAKFTFTLNRVNAIETKKSLPSNPSKRMKIVIIGGVAAGPKVASKVHRLLPESEVTLIEKGDILSYSGCGLPYYVSGVVKNQAELLSTPVKEVRDPVFFQNVKNVIVLNGTEAIKIDRDKKNIRIKNLSNNNKSWINYDKLVLATGSFPSKPQIEGINLKNIFTLHGVHDAEGIKAFLSSHNAQDVVIVGGGLIGVETTEALVARGCRVTIIEEMSQILTLLDKEIAKLVEHHLERKGVKILTDTKVMKFFKPDKNGSTELSNIFITPEEKIYVITDKEAIPSDMVILATGVKPQVKLARDSGLEIGITGAVKVNNKMMTSDPNIYAAGDCAESYDAVNGKPLYLPLGSLANKEGRVAAINICGGDEVFPGVVGSTTCKVFDYCVAKTGYTEQYAREQGFDVVCSLTAGPDKEHFMPDVKTLMIKLVVDKASRRILGAQAIGESDGYNKIDIISTAISAKMTVDQLSGLDFCYAPSFSLAIDNVVTAANVARNKLDGIFEGISSAEVYSKLINKENFILLDVRSYKEYKEVRIPNSVLIPLGVLRNRLHELPKDKEVITYCSISLRGYEASLILKNAGFTNVKVMDGGIVMWCYDLIIGID